MSNQTPIADCFWDVEIRQMGTLTKWYWLATTKETTRISDYIQSVPYPSLLEAKRGWEDHVKAAKIKQWKYVE